MRLFKQTGGTETDWENPALVNVIGSATSDECKVPVLNASSSVINYTFRARVEVALTIRDRELISCHTSNGSLAVMDEKC